MMARKSARYVALAAVTLLYLLLTAGTFNALGVVLPMMVKDIGMTWAEAGMGFTLLGIACGLASMVPAIMIRRIGVSLTLVAGGVMLAAGFGSLAVASSALTYHIGTTLLGLGFCFCGTVPGVYVVSALFEERRSTAIGIYFGAGGLGSVIGPLLFYGVEQRFGDWRVFWTMYTIAAVLIGSFAALVTTGWQKRGIAAVAAAVAAGTPETSGWTMREALRRPQFWVVVAAYTTCLLVNTTMHSFAVQHLGERGLSLGAAAALISTSALIGAIASSAAGVAGERVSPRTLVLTALTTLALAAAALIVPQTSVSLLVFGTAVGVGIGISYVGTAMLLIDWFGHRANLELYSVMCVVSTLAAVGPAVGGIERDHSGNFVAMFATLAAIAIAMAAVLLLTHRPYRRGARSSRCRPSSPDAVLMTMLR